MNRTTDTEGMASLAIVCGVCVVYIHVWIHTGMYAYAHVYVHTCIHLCAGMYVCVYLCVYMHLSLCEHMCAQMCVCVHAQTCMWGPHGGWAAPTQRRRSCGGRTHMEQEVGVAPIACTTGELH